MADEVKIEEIYRNESDTSQIGFDWDRNAYLRVREGDEWGEWQPHGSAVDYTSNEDFAYFDGCTVKVDNPASESAGTSGQ